MKKINRFLGVVLIILGAFLWYRNSQKGGAIEKIEPATLEAIPDSKLKSVRLTQKAAERTGIETQEVRWGLSTRNVTRKVVPYSSLIYDLEGKTWVYTSPKPLTFVRQGVVVDYIEGENVYLSEGPALQTLVVTVGVAELYGAETGVGK